MECTVTGSPCDHNLRPRRCRFNQYLAAVLHGNGRDISGLKRCNPDLQAAAAAAAAAHVDKGTLGSSPPSPFLRVADGLHCSIFLFEYWWRCELATNVLHTRHYAPPACYTGKPRREGSNNSDFHMVTFSHPVRPWDVERAGIKAALHGADCCARSRDRVLLA